MTHGVDKLASTDTNAPMIELGSAARGRGWALIASAATCFLLLRALAVFLSADGGG